MKTLKVLGIVGLVINVLSFLCIFAYIDEDPDIAIGWGIISLLFSTSVFIVNIVKSRTVKEIDHFDLREEIKKIINEK